jgi:hypothetical protein
MSEQTKERAVTYNPVNHSIVQAFMKADGWQRYEVSDFVEALVAALKSELERVYWNWHQSLLDEADWQLTDVGNGFEYRRYFWGDCDCGAESPVHDEACPFVKDHWEWNKGRLEAISDEPSEEEMAAGLFGRRLTFDPERERAYAEANPHPPCTCGANNNWQPRDEHLPTCSPQLPNLKYKGVEMSWYKYIGRGMSVNVDWDERRWREWFDDAMKTIRLYDTCHNYGHWKKEDEAAGRELFSSDRRVQQKNCLGCIQQAEGTQEEVER